MNQNYYNRNLLIVCYPHGWHWGLSVEFLNSEALVGNFYDVIDASFVGDNYLLIKIKKILGKYKFRKECIKFIKKNNFNYINLNKFSIKGFGRKRIGLTHDPLNLSPAYNTIMEQFGSMDSQRVKTNLRGRLITKKETQISNKLYRELTELNLQGYESVVTVNGRFNKNSTVILWSKKNKLKCKIIEFGTLTKNSFEIYENSPHSMIEIQDKIEKYWNHSTDAARILKATSYFDTMIKSKSSSGINFREKMHDGKIPSFSNKKICVFYASSEYEYAGVKVEAGPREFTSQIEAFRGLLDVLDPNEWDVYLRRHPKKNGSIKNDGEKFMWKEFYNQKNIYILEPDSDVDSLSLGASADLIASYWSTINMEFLARGYQNVINLGPTSWNRLLPSRHLPSRAEILKFISHKKQLMAVDSLLPWAYFMSDFGTEFKLIGTNAMSGEWYFKS
jgi:hypothetical protein